MDMVQNKLLESGKRCLIIGEVAQAHDGSLGTAHAYIDAIAKAGADAVKFQTHIASEESTPHEQWRIKFSLQDKSRYDYWKRMEFTEEQWLGLKKHADDCGLLFLSSPFSIAAAELLKRVGVAAWKIASGEINSDLIFEIIADTGLPILLSTGMSTTDEIDQAVKKIESRNLPFAVMQCSSIYPCQPEDVGLNLLSYFRDRYNCPVGLSDHSAKIFPGLAAVTIGIEVLEVHVTLSRQSFGPDVPASLTAEELAQLVEGVRFIEKMNSNKVDKNKMAERLSPMRKLFNKSLILRSQLDKGTILHKKHLVLKKPGTGMPESMIPNVVGKRLVKNLPADHILSESDLEIIE